MNEEGGKSFQTLHLLYIGKNEFKNYFVNKFMHRK